MSQAANDLPAPSVIRPRVEPPLLKQPPMHSGATISRIVGTQVLAGSLPLTAGLIVYGWRALATVLIVLASTTVGLAVWRSIGKRGAQVRFDHGLWQGLLLAFCLPAELAKIGHTGEGATWPLLIAAGLALAIFIWLLGGIASGRVHPVLITVLLLYICCGGMLQEHAVLQRQHLVEGDVLKAAPATSAMQTDTPWIKAPEVRDYDSVRRSSVAETLIGYTRGGPGQQRAWTSLDGIVRDQLPPLEDVMIVGEPTSIGSASNVFVIVGGLFLLYCGIIDARVPLTIVISMLMALLILPIPVVIRENEAVWRWLPLRDNAVGWRLALTLANYELMAGPLLLVSFFIANSPVVRPMTRRARQLYAVIAGVATAAAQLYVSVSIGPYLAILFASLLSPMLDRFFRPRTLV